MICLISFSKFSDVLKNLYLQFVLEIFCFQKHQALFLFHKKIITRSFWSIWIMFFCFLFYNVKVNHFLYLFIMFLHLISSFSLTRSLLVPYPYVFIESIDFILLSSFKLKAILLISSVKTLSLSLLNLCCVFNIILLFLMSFLLFF